MVGRTLIFLIIFFLPTQLGKHFWGDFSQVGGFRIDYLSPTLYFTDILIGLYLLHSLPGLITWLRKDPRPALLLFGFISLNLLFSLSPIVTFFVWLRWLLYFSLVIALNINRVTLKSVILPLSLSLILLVLLETLQLFFQSSVGGIFWFLGERTINQATPQVAKLIVNGRIILRPYSTFSHPNSLGGFLLLVLFLLGQTKSTVLKMISLVGIILTFSKTAIITTLLFLAGVFKKNRLLLILALPLIPLLITPVADYSVSLSARSYLLSPTLSIIRLYPLFGVGLGGYLPALVDNLPDNQVTPSLIQPVHNLPLLLISEIGLFGVGLLLYLTLKSKILHNPSVLELLSIVLLTGGFDHYWLTLPQNKLILLLALYFVYNKHQ